MAEEIEPTVQEMRNYLSQLKYRYHFLRGLDDERVKELYIHYKTVEEKLPGIIAKVQGNPEKVIEDTANLMRPRKKRLI